MNTPSTTVSTGRSLGWISLKKPSLPTGSLSVLIRSSLALGYHPGGEHHQVGGDGDLRAGRQLVARGHQQSLAGGVLLDHRRLVVGEAQEERALVAGLVVEELVLAVRADVAVQVVLGDPAALLARLQRGVDGARAAVARAVLVALRLPAAHAVDVDHAVHQAAVVEERTVGALHEVLELGEGEHAVKAVTQLSFLGRVAPEPGGHDQRAGLHLVDLGRGRGTGCPRGSCRSSRSCSRSRHRCTR